MFFSFIFLIELLCWLFGIGFKIVQCMVFYLLQYDCDVVVGFSQLFIKVLEIICYCVLCNIFIEQVVCEICQDSQCDYIQLCVVELFLDQVMIEQILIFKGFYFVFMGWFLLLDGIGLCDIYFEKFIICVIDGVVSEVVLVINFINEGEVIVYYISEMFKVCGLKVSCLVCGVLVGGELEYVDVGIIVCVMLDCCLI